MLEPQLRPFAFGALSPPLCAPEPAPELAHMREMQIGRLTVKLRCISINCGSWSWASLSFPLFIDRGRENPPHCRIVPTRGCARVSLEDDEEKGNCSAPLPNWVDRRRHGALISPHPSPPPLRSRPKCGEESGEREREPLRSGLTAGNWYYLSTCSVGSKANRPPSE